jgi:hypothetical protein
MMLATRFAETRNRMLRLQQLVIIIVGLVSCHLVGCRSSGVDRLPLDGVYTVTEKSTGIYLQVTNDQGAVTQCRLQQFHSFVPVRSEFHCVGGSGCFVQLTGRVTHRDWSEEQLVVIAAGTPYWELRKATLGSGAGLASITIRVPTEGIAMAVTNALRQVGFP